MYHSAFDVDKPHRITPFDETLHSFPNGFTKCCPKCRVQASLRGLLARLVEELIPILNSYCIFVSLNYSHDRRILGVLDDHNPISNDLLQEFAQTIRVTFRFSRDSTPFEIAKRAEQHRYLMFAPVRVNKIHRFVDEALSALVHTWDHNSCLSDDNCSRICHPGRDRDVSRSRAICVSPKSGATSLLPAEAQGSTSGAAGWFAISLDASVCTPPFGEDLHGLGRIGACFLAGRPARRPGACSFRTAARKLWRCLIRIPGTTSRR